MATSGCSTHVSDEEGRYKGTKDEKSTIVELSTEVARFKRKLDEYLGVLKVGEKTNEEDVRREQEIDLLKLKMENKRLKDENWLLDQHLQLKKLLKENESLKKLTEKQYDNRPLQFETTTLEMRPQMDCFNLVNKKAMFPPDFHWKIPSVDYFLEDPNTIVGPKFGWNEYAGGLAKAVCDMGTHPTSILMSLHFQQAGKPLTKKDLNPAVYYLLKDRSESESAKHIVMAAKCLFPAQATLTNIYDKLFVHKNKLVNPRYNIHNSIIIDIYIEPPAMVHAAHSYNGALNWVIDNYYTKRKEAQEDGVVFYESPYFYTGRKGHRVQVEMWLNRALSVDILFLQGEFDDNLPTYFPHRTTITLLNRKRPERNVTKSVSNKICDFKNHYMVDLCSLEEVESLVENDTLYCTVMIESTFE